MVRSSLGRRRFRLAVTVAAVCSAGLVTAGAAQADEYVVVVKDTADGAAVAARYGVKPRLVYRSALHGFAGNLGKGVNERLQADPAVRFTAVDILKERNLPGINVPPPGQVNDSPKLNTFAQLVPFGIDRVDADRSRTADIDGKDDARVNADI